MAVFVSWCCRNYYTGYCYHAAIVLGRIMALVSVYCRFNLFFGTVCTRLQHHTFIGVYNGKGNFETLRDGETLLSKLESET